MKNKITMTSRLTVAATLLAAVCLGGSAFALDLYGKKKTSPSASPAVKKETAGGALSAKDKDFMHNAAKGGMMEVAMGKMAEEKAQNSDVKAFGKRMVTDHSKANNELMALAEKKGVKLPNEKPAKHWSSDKDYIDMMVKDHEKDLAEFQAEASNGSDPDLKKFADRTAKVVQKHLDLAKQTQGKLK
jgi:putative membrane protein